MRQIRFVCWKCSTWSIDWVDHMGMHHFQERPRFAHLPTTLGNILRAKWFEHWAYDHQGD